MEGLPDTFYDEVMLHICVKGFNICGEEEPVWINRKISKFGNEMINILDV